MFDQKNIDSYRSISAPDELRTRVMRIEKKKAVTFDTKTVRNLIAVAACAVLVITCVFSFANSGIPICVNGEKLSYREVSVSYSEADTSVARTVPVLGIDFEFDIKRSTAISVNEGIMQIYDAETGAHIASDTKYLTNKDVKVVWEISAYDLGLSYNMFVTDSKNNYTITPKFDASENCWKISRTKN